MLLVEALTLNKCFSEDDFEAVLVTFGCYDYGANSSEAVKKIVRD